MNLPVNERRFFLGMLTKEAGEREEKMEEMKNKQKTSGSKGSRSTTVSGNALKSKIKSGEIPLV